jgi:hypothetical protein
MISLFRRQRHLSQRVLNEYLDNLLPAASRRQADGELAACAGCRQALAGLTAAVAALKQLPQLPVRRSFTLAAPPRQVVVQAPVVLRLPNWTYAGAASLTGLFLAVLVSADAAGLLAPRESAPAIERFMAAPAPEATPGPETDQARTMKSAEPVSVSPDAGQTVPPPAAAVTLTGATLEPGPGVAAAPSAGPTGLAGSAGSAGPAGPATDAEPVAKGTRGYSELTATYNGGLSVATDGSPPGATPWLWRALEGVAAVAALLFVLALLLRRRMTRR